MQAAKEYDLQFNNILKKEEYKKYVSTHSRNMCCE